MDVLVKKLVHDPGQPVRVLLVGHEEGQGQVAGLLRQHQGVEYEAGQHHGEQRLAPGLEAALLQLQRPLPQDPELGLAQRQLLEQRDQLRLLASKLHLHGLGGGRGPKHPDHEGEVEVITVDDGCLAEHGAEEGAVLQGQAGRVGDLVTGSGSRSLLGVIRDQTGQWDLGVIEVDSVVLGVSRGQGGDRDGAAA